MSNVDDKELLNEYLNIKEKISDYNNILNSLESTIDTALRSAEYFANYNGSKITPPDITRKEKTIKKEYYKAVINNNTVSELEKLQKTIEKAKEKINEYNSYANEINNLSGMIEAARIRIQNNLQNVKSTDILNMSELLSKIAQIKYLKEKPFVYGWNNRTTSLHFEDSKENTTTCVNTTALVLYELGIIDEKKYISSNYIEEDNNDSNGIKKVYNFIKNLFKNKDTIDRNFNTIANKDNETVSDLIKNKKLKKGDIVIYENHINIYKGKNEKGEDLWYDSGRSTPGCIEQNNKKVFQSFGPFTTNQLKEAENKNEDSNFDIDKSIPKGILHSKR